MKRKGLSKRLRFSIFTRDEFTCRYCGRQSDEVQLVIDHIIPVAKGGTNDPENLVTACETCNQGKGAKELPAAIPADNNSLARLQELREQRELARAQVKSTKIRKQLRQDIVDALCSVTRNESVDGKTVSVLASYGDRNGYAMVMKWIEQAGERLDTTDERKIGRYVSGIRRSLIEKGTITNTP